MKNWDDLKVFHAMQGARSIREAAATLKTTHSTLSRRLRALEEELGNTLFERGRDGYELTPFGQSILTFSQEIAAHFEAIDRMVFANNATLAGPLRVSMLDEVYSYVLADALGAFMQDHPMIDLSLETTTGLSDLARREADVIVRITKSPPEQAVGRKVADSPLAGYASPDYLADRPARDRWVALEYPPARAPLNGARVVMTAGKLEVAATAIAQGQGFGLLPCFVGDSHAGLVRVPEIPPRPDVEIWVLTHLDVRSHPRVRALMDHLYHAFAGQRRRIEGLA